MSIGGLVAGGIIFLVTIGWIALPLLKQRKAARSSVNAEKSREQLLMIYERILNNLRDLDEDYNTGKMPDGAYQQEREDLIHDGTQVLMDLDALQGTKTKAMPTTPTSTPSDADDEIEKAVAAYRARAKQA